MRPIKQTARSQLSLQTKLSMKIILCAAPVLNAKTNTDPTSPFSSPKCRPGACLALGP